MKKLFLCLLAASASFCAGQDTPTPTTTPAKPAKQSREAFLQSQVADSAEACKRQIVATAKNPDSVKFLDEPTVEFGRVLTRNNIFITFQIMGMNTYGAVLRHTMLCTVQCDQKKGGCYTPSISE